MRRLSIILALAAILSPFLAAAPASSAFIPLDSTFYEDYDLLMASIGRQPNRSRPFSYGEARVYLSQIDDTVLSDAQEALYGGLLDQAGVEEDETISFVVDGHISPAIYIHTDTEHFRDRVDFLNSDATMGGGSPEYHYENVDKFLLWDREREHFADIDLTLSFADSVSLVFRLPIANTVHTGVPTSSRILMTNIPFLASVTDLDVNVFQDFSMNFPYRAGISFGNDWFNLTIGRERFSYGSGMVGDFVIDEALPYHNALSLSFFTQTFKYNFLISFFPHPSQYILTDADGDVLYSEDGQSYQNSLIFDQNSDAFTGIKFFMAHRFEWTMAEGRHRFAITEGIMYQNDKGIVDLQVLNPMMLFHNMYIAGNSNSILQAEWDSSFDYGIGQHIAIAVDDLAIPFEETDGSQTRPNAIGMQYGITYTSQLGPGFLANGLDLTYMSPYFYLRDGKDPGAYPLDFVVAIRNQRSAFGVYDLYTIGFPGGGDQAVIAFNSAYSMPGIFDVGLDVEYSIHGPNNLMTVYGKGDGDKPNTHSLTVTLSASYDITPSVRIETSLADRYITNYDNSSHEPVNDIAFDMTLSCSF